MSAIQARQVLEKYYGAFNEGDMVGFLALLHPSVVHDINQGERETGKQAFADFMLRMNHCYREQITDLVLMVNEDGTRAAAEFTVLGTYLETDAGLPPAQGQTYRLAAGAFFELNNGQISRVTNYYNLREWLTQVGVSEA